MTKLITDPSLHQRLSLLISRWDQQWQTLSDVSACQHLRQQMLKLLPHYQDAYWNTHFTFEKTHHPKKLPLMGEQIKMEILVNTVMPILYAQILHRSNLQEHNAFQRFFSYFPATVTGKTRYLKHRFFGDTQKGDLLKQADIQQGAYQLHRDFCLNYESSCNGCPFVDRYIQYF